MSFLKPKVSFSSNFSSYSSAVRVNSSVLFHPNVLCFGLKEPIKCKLSDFQLLAWKLTKFLVIFHELVFTYILLHPSVSWHITSPKFSSWNCTWFGPKEHIKVQNFLLWTFYVKFHQICTLIGYFSWKYIKFQLKKYRGVMSHHPEYWTKVWRKTDLLF